METESLDDQEVSNLASLTANLQNSSSTQNTNWKGRKHSFFQRSDSTLCLGCPPPDPFETPMSEALPLADQPHLLQPNARREDLFGIPKQPISLSSTNSNPENPLEALPERLSLSTRTSDFAMNEPAKAHHPISPSFNVMGPTPIMYPENYLSEDSEKPKEVVEPEPQASSSAGPSCSKTSPKKNYKSFECLLAAVKNETGEERPQDLSFPSKDVSMPMDTSTFEQKGNFSSPSLMVSLQDIPTPRPQIIVSPRKVASAIEIAERAVERVRAIFLFYIYINAHQLLIF